MSLISKFFKTKPKAQKQQRQFSKIHVIFADVLVFCVYAGSWLLSWFGKEPISDVALGIISVYGAFATGGYFTLNAIRDVSINRLKATHVENHIKPEDSNFYT